MKIWVKFVYGANSQKILATWLFFTKNQSTLKKRPPMQNFTIYVLTKANAIVLQWTGPVMESRAAAVRHYDIRM